ncbi:hypothetical protein WA577_006762, partial [Blastocystis sp. JDR]
MQLKQVFTFCFAAIFFILVVDLIFTSRSFSSVSCSDASIWHSFFQSYVFVDNTVSSLRSDTILEEGSSATEIASAAETIVDTENNEMQTTASTRHAPRGAKWKSRRKQSARKKTKVRETAPVDQPLGLNYPPDHIDQNRVSFLQQILNPAIQSALRSVCSHDACSSQLARYRNLTRQWEEEPLERFATAEELASLRAFTGKNPQQLQRRYQRLWMARGEEAERAALPARERRIEKL